MENSFRWKPRQKWQQNYCFPELENSHFTGHSDIWKKYCLGEETISYIYIFPGQRIQHCLDSPASRHIKGVKWPPVPGDLRKILSCQIPSVHILKLYLQSPYIRGTSQAGFLEMSSSLLQYVERWQQFIGCINTWGIDQIIVHSNFKEEMQLN